jgi:hypothetical protein
VSAVTRSHERDGTEALLGLAFLVPLAAWSGYVAMTLWNWFVPVVFPAAPRLGILSAIGLGMVVGVFTAKAQDAEPSSKSAGYMIVYSLFMGLVRLGIGLVVHLLLGAMT